jgi:hypothetical protein
MSEPDRTKLPIRRPPFGGVCNRALDGSKPGWNLIRHPEPAKGSPDVLLVLINETGRVHHVRTHLPMDPGAAHAKTGAPVAVAGYPGSDAFDLPVTDFSQCCADQNEKDYPAVRHRDLIRAAGSPRRRLKLGCAC